VSSSLDERFVELQLGRVRVLERAGDGERTVLFAHGITSSARTWEPFLAALPEEIRGIAFDSFGNGYSELSGGRRPITIEDHADQVLQLLDQLGVERFAGVGHSMGAAPLLRVALQRPELLDGLLLEAPTALGRPKLALPMRLARRRVTARLMEAVAPRLVRSEARRRLKGFAGERKVTEEMFEREAGHALARPVEQVRGFRDLIGHGDPRRPAADIDRYPRIACPVWILRGSEDRDWMPASREERFRELIPAARIIRWDGIGHAPHIQAPDRFATLLGEFIGSTG
jgi:pimeloyl-ACP methyl ester carboxylesterase